MITPKQFLSKRVYSSKFIASLFQWNSLQFAFSTHQKLTEMTPNSPDNDISINPTFEAFDFAFDANTFQTHFEKDKAKQPKSFSPDMSLDDLIEFSIERLSRKEQVQPELQAEIAETFLKNSKEFTGDNIHLVTWVLASFGILQKPLVDHIQDYILENMYLLTASQKATIIWAFTTANRGSTKFWQEITAKFTASSGMSASDCAHVVWGLTTQRMFSDDLWNPLGKAISNVLPNMDSEKDLAVIIWAFAKSNKGSHALWERFALKFELLAPKMDSNSLASCLWSFSHQGLTITKSTAIEAAASKLLGKMTPQEICCLLYAINKSKIGSSKLRKLVLEEIAFKLADSKTNWPTPILGMLVYSLGQLVPADEILQKAIQEKVVELKDHLLLAKKDSILTFLYGFSRFEKLTPEVISLLEELALKIIGNCKENEVAAIYTAFAKKNIGSKSFWNKIKHRYRKNLTTLGDQELTTLFWVLHKTHNLEPDFAWNIVYVLTNRANSIRGADLQRALLCLRNFRDEARAAPFISKIKTRFVNGENFGFPPNLETLLPLAQFPDKNVSVELAFWEKAKTIMDERVGNFTEEDYICAASILGENISRFSSTFLKLFDNNFSKIIPQTKIETVCFVTKRLGKHHKFFPKIIEAFESLIKEQALHITDNEVKATIVKSLYACDILDATLWSELEVHIVDNLNITTSSAFITIANYFARAKLGSFAFWTEVLQHIDKLLKYEKLSPNDLARLGNTLSQRRKGENVTWGLLEKRLVKCLPDISPPLLVVLAASYANIPKVSVEFWDMIFTRIKADFEFLPVRRLMVLYAKTLENTSISNEDKTWLKIGMQKKVLQETEQLPENIASLAIFENIAPKLDKEFRVRLEKMVEDYLASHPEFAGDSVQKEVLMLNLHTIDKNAVLVAQEIQKKAQSKKSAAKAGEQIPTS